MPLEGEEAFEGPLDGRGQPGVEVARPVPVAGAEGFPQDAQRRDGREQERIEISRVVDGEAGSFEKRREGVEAVASLVLAHDVLPPVEEHERRNRHEEPAFRSEHATDLVEGAVVLLDVLEHVEDENGVKGAFPERKRERVRPRREREGGEARIEGCAVDGDKPAVSREHFRLPNGADADGEGASGVANEAIDGRLEDPAAGTVPPVLVLELGHAGPEVLLHWKTSSIAQRDSSSASAASRLWSKTFAPASTSSGREYSSGV